MPKQKIKYSRKNNAHKTHKGKKIVFADVKTKTSPILLAVIMLYLFIGCVSVSVVVGLSILTIALRLAPAQAPTSQMQAGFTMRTQNASSYIFPEIPSQYGTAGYIKDFKNSSAPVWTLRIVSGINTAGVHLAASARDSIQSFSLYYRLANGIWLRGHAFTGSITGTKSISDDTKIPYDYYVSSLFHLSPGQGYEVRADLYNSEGLLASQILGNFDTQPDVFVFNPGATINITSGNISDIQDAIDNAAPGADIRVSGGPYFGKLVFSKSGEKDKWIRLLGDGSTVIDGSDQALNNTFSGGWVKTTLSGCERNCENIWQKPASGDYWGIWVSENGGEYNYLYRHTVSSGATGRDNFNKSVSGQIESGEFCVPGDTLSPPRVIAEDSIVSQGYHIENKIMYLRLEPGKTPDDYSFKISKHARGIDIGSQSWVWVEGLTLSYFGNTEYSAAGINIRNGNYNIIRNNKIHQTKNGVKIEWTNADNDSVGIGMADDGAAFNRIESNDITTSMREDLNYYCKVKKGGSFIAVSVAGTVGNIVRNNTMYNIGENALQIQLLSDSAAITGCGRKPDKSSDDGHPCAMPFAFLLSDTDIYDNVVRDNVEAIEPDGGQVINTRIVGNIFRNIEISLFSLQAGEYGPTWFVRNIISKSQESQYNIRSLEVFKFRGENLSKYAYIYHNDIYLNSIKSQTAYRSRNYFENWNMVFRNNIFHSQGQTVAQFPSPEGMLYYGVPDMDYDSFSNDSLPGANPKLTIAWQKKDMNWTYCGTIDCLNNIGGLEKNGGIWFHGFADPEKNVFNLKSTSKNIDVGVKIPGINDQYCGNNPDMGAMENKNLCQTNFIRSDVNDDGNINITDVIYLLNYLFSDRLISVSCLDAADIDDNSVVEITDAIYLLAYLFQGGDLPREPFNQCGIDQTADIYGCDMSAVCS